MKKRIALVAVPMAAAVALILSACGTQTLAEVADGNSTPSPSATAPVTSEKKELTNDQLKELSKLMNSKEEYDGNGTYVCATTDKYDHSLVTYRVESLMKVGKNGRTNPDDIGTPITAKDADGARSQLQESICKDPLLGSTWLTFLATDARDQLLKQTDNKVDLVALNPELKSFTDISKVKSLAGKYDPNEFVSNPNLSQVNAALNANEDWQSKASMANTLLDRFKLAEKFEERKSTVNYHLSDYSYGASSFATVTAAKKQESLPALIFLTTEKGQCGEITAFGANIEDKRPELFSPKSCETPNKTPNKPGTPSTPDKPNTPTTPNKPGTPSTPDKPNTPTTPNNPPPANPCPPGNTIPSCAPKSHDAGDYTHPAGKPPAKVTTPPEATPPKVTTTKPGGGGVVDTPTKPPGSETGTTAPGATPAPPKATTPPPNQGGTSGPGDPGGF